MVGPFHGVLPLPATEEDARASCPPPPLNDGMAVQKDVGDGTKEERDAEAAEDVPRMRKSPRSISVRPPLLC